MPGKLFRVSFKLRNTISKSFGSAGSFTIQIILLSFALLFIGTPSVQAYSLPDTGQTKCYGDTYRIWCPQPGEPFYGQDAEYDGPGQAYQDNGDGTVTDLNTGLLWQQEGHQYTYDDGIQDYQQDAADYCAVLNLGGRSDWRLPSRHELVTIVDFGKPGPMINSQYFPIAQWSAGDHWYWSAEFIYAIDRRWGCFVDFETGRMTVAPSEFTACVARCVSNNPLLCPSYTDNYDGTVTASESGLMWQQSDDAIPRTWEDALVYCEDLSLGGFDDWRLPNVTEFEGLVCSLPNYEAFPWHWGYSNWSSTTGNAGSDKALAYIFSRQLGVNTNNIVKSGTGYAQCVRGGSRLLLLPLLLRCQPPLAHQITMTSSHI